MSSTKISDSTTMAKTRPKKAPVDRKPLESGNAYHRDFQLLPKPHSTTNDLHSPELAGCKVSGIKSQASVLRSISTSPCNLS